MKARSLLAALAACSLAAGCSGDKPGDPRGAAKPATAASAAEGMCKEHGVLEAVCTKCNASLIPVFQAKGDWCAQHGFPMSFCPTCHPERGGKPVGDVGRSDGAPPDGTKIRFKRKDIAQLAGIATAKAAIRPAAGGVVTTVRLVYDATRLAHLNARSAGVVRALKVDVGARVEKGDPLLEIDSPDVGANRSRLGAAHARVTLAEENYKREEELQKEGISAKRSLLEARQELAAARAERQAIAASLSVMGAAAGGTGGYTISSPIRGVVTERTATIGKLVTSDQVLFEIVDTSSIWAELDVPEAELVKVAPGQAVSLTVDALPGRSFDGKIDYLAPAVDPKTRTARARCALLNPDGGLRAQMFGQARITVENEHPAVMVPRASIQRAKEVHLAFVKVADDQFETRRVTLGITDGDQVEVTKGLKPGEEVVTVGSFLLKTETLKDSIGAGCCETD
jgi:membrane fusion protein, heavy metal efflux system